MWKIERQKKRLVKGEASEGKQQKILRENDCVRKGESGGCAGTMGGRKKKL